MALTVSATTIPIHAADAVPQALEADIENNDGQQGESDEAGGGEEGGDLEGTENGDAAKIIEEVIARYDGSGLENEEDGASILEALMGEMDSIDIASSMEEVIGEHPIETAEKIMQLFFDASEGYEKERGEILEKVKEIYGTYLDEGTDTSSIEEAEDFTGVSQAFWELYKPSMDGTGDGQETDNLPENEGGTNGEPEEPGNTGDLEAVRADALADLDAIGASIPDSVKEEATVILEQAKAEINAAVDAQAIATILADAKTRLNSYVTSGTELSEEINNAINELANIDISALEGADLEKAQALIEDAKKEFYKCTTSDEIAQILTATRVELSSILNGAALEKQKTVAKDGLRQYYEGLSIEIAELGEAAETVYQEGLKAIDEAKDTDGVNQAFETAKKNLDSIMEGTDEILDQIKENAVQEVKDLRDTLTGAIAMDASEIAIKHIQDAEDIKAASSAKKIALDIMENLKGFYDGNDAMAGAVIQALQATVSDTEIRTLLDHLYSAAGDEPESCVADAVEAISDPDGFSGYLIQKVKEEAAFVTVQKEEAQAIVTGFEKDVQGKTLKEIYGLYEKACAEIARIRENDPLAKVKEEAVKGLEALLNGVTDSGLKADIQEVILKAEIAIESCDTEAEVEQAVEDAEKEVEGLKDEFEKQTALEQAKENAVKRVDNLIANVTDSELRAILTNITDSAKSSIQRAGSETEINNIVQQTVTDIKEATLEYSKDKTLLTKKTEAVKKLEELAAGKTLNASLNLILSQGKIDIMDADTTEQVDSIYQTVTSSFNTAYLQMLKEDYSDRLDSLVAGIQADTDVMASISQVVAKAKENITNASNAEVMENIYRQAESAIQTLADSAGSLSQIKADAIAQLNNYTTLNTDSANKVKSVYTNRINSAQNAQEVASYLSEAEGLLDRLVEAADANVQDPSQSALYNANTSTTSMEKDAAQAMAKNGTEGTSMVKTGDENGINIIISLLAVLGGAGVIGWIAYKIFRKRKK